MQLNNMSSGYIFFSDQHVLLIKKSDLPAEIFSIRAANNVIIACIGRSSSGTVFLLTLCLYLTRTALAIVNGITSASETCVII